MDIQDLGALGELIGSVAVLATLVYLALQTRQNIKGIRQKSHSDILSRRLVVFSALDDREFIEIWSKGCNQDPLDALDAQRFTTFGVMISAHIQDAFIQFQQGLINEDVWEAEAMLLQASFSQPGFVDWWQHGKQFLTPEFISQMETMQPVNMVLYDPDTQKWGRPDDGAFGKDASEQTA
jgi:hypothetical protein